MKHWHKCFQYFWFSGWWCFNLMFQISLKIVANVLPIKLILDTLTFNFWFRCWWCLNLMFQISLGIVANVSFGGLEHVATNKNNFWNIDLMWWKLELEDTQKMFFILLVLWLVVFQLDVKHIRSMFQKLFLLVATCFRPQNETFATIPSEIWNIKFKYHQQQNQKLKVNVSTINFIGSNVF